MRAFIGIVVLADAVFLAVAASRVSIRAHDLELFAVLLLCSAATVELTKRVGENTGFVQDVHAVWELPVAMLLPLAYAPILPVIRFTLTQWRILRVPVHRRAFSAAAIGLSHVAAAFVFHALIRLAPGAGLEPGWSMPSASGAVFVAACAVVMWVVNQGLVLTAIKGSDRSVKLREEQFAREPIYNDVTELCVAVLVTFCLANSIIAAAFAFPFVSLLQRSLRHARLVQDSRVDSKTGLLNVATWERGSKAEVARAVRTKTPLAVAMLDIDRFKAINETYGDLLGDQFIEESATLNTLLRATTGRAVRGGEELWLRPPQTIGTRVLYRGACARETSLGGSIIVLGAGRG